MRIVVYVLLALSLTACGEEWTAFAYPDKNDLTVHKEFGPFESLEACRDAAMAAIDINRGDYECGLNCEAGSYPLICEKTLR